MSMAVGLSNPLEAGFGISCHPSLSSSSTRPAVPVVLLTGLDFFPVPRRVGDPAALPDGCGTKCCELIFSDHSPGWKPSDCCGCGELRGDESVVACCFVPLLPVARLTGRPAEWDLGLVGEEASSDTPPAVNCQLPLLLSPGTKLMLMLSALGFVATEGSDWLRLAPSLFPNTDDACWLCDAEPWFGCSEEVSVFGETSSKKGRVLAVSGRGV